MLSLFHQDLVRIKGDNVSNNFKRFEVLCKDKSSGQRRGVVTCGWPPTQRDFRGHRFKLSSRDTNMPASHCSALHPSWLLCPEPMQQGGNYTVYSLRDGPSFSLTVSLLMWHRVWQNGLWAGHLFPLCEPWCLHQWCLHLVTVQVFGKSVRDHVCCPHHMLADSEFSSTVRSHSMSPTYSYTRGLCK